MINIENLDVTDSMKNNIKIIQDVISDLGIDPDAPGALNTDQKQKIKTTISILDRKIDEIEDYFWRPLDSPEVYEQLKKMASVIGEDDKVKKFDTKLNRIAANEQEFKGRVQNFFGNNTEALKYYEEAVKLSPDHELANAGVEKASKSLAKARVELPKLEQKIIDKPGDVKSLYKYALALLNMNRVEEAIKNFDRLIELDPNNPDAWAKRGTATESLGKYEESKKYFDKALEIKPSSTTAKRGKNYALYFLGELDAEQLD
ncbi:tetratricopeptide repeat protein [[Eubacterium] cellulosolvens]